MMRQGFADKVFAFTAEKRLFSAPCHILLGLSGGADSMALLHVLSHWSTPGLQVSAVHIHHGLRENEADMDEAFVRDYCASARIPLTVVHADVAAVAREQRLSLEEAGRRVRYTQFEKVRVEIGADYVVTAHTASDQTETVLMHLIRGCGVDGLTGIPAARGCIRRPLLCCQRQEVEEYCLAHRIPFVTDSTNLDTRYTRNGVRHRVLPLLREINPSVEQAVLRLSKCAAEESDYLNELAERALESAVCPGGSQTEVFAEQSVVIRRRMIRLLLRNHGVSTIEESHILAAEKVILCRNGSVDLSDRFVFSVEQGIVSIRRAGALVSASPMVIEDLPCSVTFVGNDFTLDVLPVEEANVHKLFVNYAIDCDRIQGKLCLRCRQTGDYLHPAGRGVGKSLKKWMNEWHIPAHRRDGYPVLCDEAGVVLVPGYACDERVRVTDATKRVMVCKTKAGGE